MTPRKPDGAKTSQCEGEDLVLLVRQQRRRPSHLLDPVIDDETEEAGDERTQQVDESGEHNAHHAVPGAARGQDALDHHLVGGLVKEKHAKCRRDETEERRFRIAGRMVEMEALGAAWTMADHPPGM